MIRDVLSAGSPGGDPGGRPAGGVHGVGAADRFCAWAGRSGRRVIFSVEAAEPDGSTLAVRGVVLGVRRDAGRRRVLWSSVLDGRGPTPVQRQAIALLRQAGCGEVHVHVMAGGSAGCEAVAAELGLPRLEAEEPLRLAS